MLVFNAGFNVFLNLFNAAFDVDLSASFNIFSMLNLLLLLLSAAVCRCCGGGGTSRDHTIGGGQRPTTQDHI